MTAPSYPAPRSAQSRALITLVVDTSESIERIGATAGLNQALRQWGRDLIDDDNLARIGEIAMVTFGHEGVRTVNVSGATPAEPAYPFVSARLFNPGVLRASGYSPMLEGIERGIEVIYQGARELDRQDLLLAYRPVLCLITDGAPTDERGWPTTRLPAVIRRIQSEEADHNLVFFAIGVPGADSTTLQALAGPDGYFPLERVNFLQALRLLTASADRVKKMAGAKSATDIKREVRRDTEEDVELRSWLLGGTG